MSVFFDSNVLLYLAQDDVRKATIAQQLLSDGGFVSVQVLNEMMHVARRRFRYDWNRTGQLIDNIRDLTRVVDLSIAIHDRGRDIAERYRLSVFDGMIVAAALSTNCDVLYSEDMHSGLLIDGGLQIANPFA